MLTLNEANGKFPVGGTRTSSGKSCRTSLQYKTKFLMKIDGWYRRRLRMVIRKQWKRIKTRFQNLMKLGISRFQAMMFSNTRRSYWSTVQSQILSTSISNESHQKGRLHIFLDLFSLRLCVN